MAYISCAILEGARDGRTVAELMDYGRTLLARVITSYSIHYTKLYEAATSPAVSSSSSPSAAPWCSTRAC